MSSNSTEAPTSGVTEAALAKQTSGKGLSQTQMEFVTLQCQFFGINGRLMNIEEAVAEYWFEEAEFTKLITNKKVLAAIEERGATARSVKHLSVEPLTDETGEVDASDPGAVGDNVKSALEQQHSWKDSVLTPLQLIVANAMLDLVDTRSQKKKLQDLGVSTSKYNMWLKDPVFQGYLRDRAEAMLGENQHEAHLALLDKVRMGDMKAISYYNELTGRYTQSTQAQTGTNVVLDFKNLMIRVLEIINDEVDGPTAIIISERLKGLIGATSTAGALIQASATLDSEPIAVPHIAEVRQLTPRLQQLMDEGEGNN